LSKVDIKGLIAEAVTVVMDWQDVAKKAVEAKEPEKSREDF